MWLETYTSIGGIVGAFVGLGMWIDSTLEAAEKDKVIE